MIISIPLIENNTSSSSGLILPNTERPKTNNSRRQGHSPFLFSLRRRRHLPLGAYYTPHSLPSKGLCAQQREV